MIMCVVGMYVYGEEGMKDIQTGQWPWSTWAFGIGLVGYSSIAYSVIMKQKEALPHTG